MKENDNKSAHNSKEYDEGVRRTIPYYDLLHSETISLVKAYNPDPELWVDTGCGSGSLVARATEEFNTTKFILADPSFEMLKLAMEKLKSNKNIVSFEIFSSEDINEYIVKKSDVITAIQSHHYFDREKRKKATQACFNALSDNGIYITFENTSPLTEKGITLGKSRWVDFQVASGKDREAALKHMERFNREYFPLTIPEHLELYSQCGFKTVELFWFSYMQAGFYCLKN